MGKQKRVIKASPTGDTRILGYKQVEEDPFSETGSYEADGLLQPPYAMDVLLDMPEYSTILQQCIDAYKRNIPGFGVEVVEDETAEGSGERELQLVENWLTYFNYDKSFKDIFEQVIDDRERCGNGYIELLRDNKNAVAGGENVDPKYMRVSRLGERQELVHDTPMGKQKRYKRFRKYAQRLGDGTTVWFKEYGDPRHMDCTTGEYTETFNGDNEATEILHFKVGNKPYGVPRWIGHLVHMYGARNAEELNYNYFQNGRHTPMAVVVSNGMLTDDSFEQLQDYADNLKGVDNAHSFLLLEAEGIQESTENPMEEKHTNMKVELKPLAEMLQQDGLFLEYGEQSSKKVQSVYRLPDLYVGKNTDFNRATAETAKQVAEEQVFTPERESLEFTINHLLRGFSIKNVKIRFKTPVISDTEEKVALLTVLKDLNAVAPNDVRDLAANVLGKELEPFELEEANLPLALSNLIQKAENDKQRITQAAQTKANVQKAQQLDEMINVLKDVRDGVGDYSEPTYGEHSKAY